jgi:beta-lactamase regulating signal transducer with metallopeptidase domain
MLTQIETLVTGSVLECSAVLVAGLVAWGLLRKSSAAHRHLVLAISLIGCAFLPVGKGLLPKIAVPVLPSELSSIPLTAPLPALPIPENHSSQDSPSSPNSHLETTFAPPLEPQLSQTASLLAPPAPSARPQLVAFRWRVLWWIGPLLMAGSLAFSAFGLRRLRLSSRRIQLPEAVCDSAASLLAGRPFPEVREHSSVRIPMITGALRPVIYLPAGRGSWSEDCLTAVIRHEIAHLVRGDLKIQWAVNVSLALYGFHPLAWLVAGLLGKEREKACDDLVLATGNRPSVYAESLLEVICALKRSGRGRQWLPTHAIGMAQQPSKIAARIQAILSGAVNRARPTRGRVAWSVAMAAVMIVALGAVRLAHAAPASPKAAPTTLAAKPAPSAEPKGGADASSPFEDPDPDGRWCRVGKEVGSVLLTILDEAGHPVENAEVTQDYLLASNGGYAFRKKDGIITSELLKTNAKGEVNVRYPAVIRDQPSLRMRVRISHPDYCSADPYVVFADPKPITIVRGTRLVVRAHAPGSSKPLDKVHVEVAGDWHSFLPKREPGSVSVRLPDSTYFVRAIALQEDGRFLFSSPAKAELSGGGDQVLDLEVTPGTEVRGRFSDSVPRPVVSGSVCAKVDLICDGQEKHSPLQIQSLSWHVCAPVEPDGTFVLKDLPEGEVWAVGLCEGFVSQDPEAVKGWDTLHAQFLTRSGSAELKMERSGIAEIRVLTPEGAPVVNASVGFSPNQQFRKGGGLLGSGGSSAKSLRYRLETGKPLGYSLERNDPYAATTGSDGVARVGGLPAGKQSFYVNASTLQMPVSPYPGCMGRREGMVELKPGEVAKQTVRMELKPGVLADGAADPKARVVEVSGVVATPEGQPVSGAQVVLYDARSNRPLLELYTSETGAFSARITVHADPRGVVAQAVAFCLWRGEHAVGGGPIRAGANKITMEKQQLLRGKVIDTAGKPVKGAEVRLIGIPKSEGATSWFIDVDQAPIKGAFTSVTGEDGVWELRGVPAQGKATVQMEAPGAVVERNYLSLGSAPPPFVYRPEAALTGTVLYPDGRPAPGVRVIALATQHGPGSAEAFTGADGSYRVPGLPSGTYNLCVDGQEADYVAVAQEKIVATEGQTSSVPNFLLTHGALVEGTVTDEQKGTPLEGVSVANNGPHRPKSTPAVLTAVTDSHGHFRLRVAPGANRFYLCGWPPGTTGSSQSIDLNLKEGEHKSVSFKTSLSFNPVHFNAGGGFRRSHRRNPIDVP